MAFTLIELLIGVEDLVLIPEHFEHTKPSGIRLEQLIYVGSSFSCSLWNPTSYSWIYWQFVQMMIAASLLLGTALQMPSTFSKKWLKDTLEDPLLYPEEKHSVKYEYLIILDLKCQYPYKPCVLHRSPNILSISCIWIVRWHPAVFRSDLYPCPYAHFGSSSEILH